MNSRITFGERGFSLLEVLTVIALFGVLCTVAFSNLRVLENPLVSGGANISHYLRLVRSRAISQTRSIRVRPSAKDYIIAGVSTTCESEDFSPLSDLKLDLGNHVTLKTTDWEICFNQRGLAKDAVAFTIQSGSESRLIEIALGGGVQVR